MHESCCFTGDAPGRFEWRQRTAPPVSPASFRKATTPKALSTFARCHGSLPPATLLAELRSALGTARHAIREDFELSGDGFGAARGHSELMDALVLHLLALAARRVSPAASKAQGGQLAVAAVGGYGRAELAPSSDLDVLFLTADRRTVHAVQSIEFVLYTLWDLGLRVGHAVRSVGDCIDLARSDWRTAISLLDVRFLWGQRALYDGLVDRFRTEIEGNGEALVDALLCDLAKRHARFQDPKAPDVKHGRGGLRDLQTLLWLAKLRGEMRRTTHVGSLLFLDPADYSSHTGAARFLWCVRGHLHYLTGRAEERLSEDLQPDVVRRMLWHERPERRCAATLMHQFREATGQIAGLSGRFVRQ